MNSLEIAKDKAKRVGLLQKEINDLEAARDLWAATTELAGNYRGAVVSYIKPYRDFESYVQFIREQSDDFTAAAAVGIAEIVRQLNRAINEREIKLQAIFKTLPDVLEPASASDEPSDT